MFFLGQFVSVIGNWMQTVALAALVLDHLDRGGTVLGLVTAMLYTPVIVLGPLGGLATDRFSKWQIVLTTQISFAVVVGLLGVLVIAFDPPRALSREEHEILAALVDQTAVTLKSLEKR